MSRYSPLRGCILFLFIMGFILFSSVLENANVNVNVKAQESTPNNNPSAIDVGSYPVGIRMNPITNKIYVANQYSNTISVIDGSNDQVISTIKVESFPYDLDVNPFNNRIYVSDFGDNIVVVIDGSTNKVIGSIPVGDRPSGINVNIRQNLLYVANYLSNTVSIVNGTNYKLIKNIPVGKSPVGLSMNPVTKKVYVSNIGDNSVSVIDTSVNVKVHDISLDHMATSGPKNKDPILNLPVKVHFLLIAGHVAINIDKNLIYVTN